MPTERFVDRYENIGVAGLAYYMFLTPHCHAKAFTLNCHVYSALLIENNQPFRWRGRYNEDTDLCLQVLRSKKCTVLMNSFFVSKTATMRMKGGNADIYAGRGRLKMARALEHAWPGIAKVIWKYGRPTHFVDWSKFKTQLRLKPGINLADFPPVDEMGMTLKAVKPIKSKRLQEIVSEYQHRQEATA